MASNGAILGLLILGNVLLVLLALENLYLQLWEITVMEIQYFFAVYLKAHQSSQY